jgi:hypothetical protein
MARLRGRPILSSEAELCLKRQRGQRAVERDEARTLERRQHPRRCGGQHVAERSDDHALRSSRREFLLWPGRGAACQRRPARTKIACHLSFRFHQPLRCVEPARAVTRRTDELGVYWSACVGNRLYANSTSLMIIVTGQPQHARATRGRIIKMEFSNLNAASHIVGTKNEHVYRPRSHRRFGCIRFLIVFPELDSS